MRERPDTCGKWQSILPQLGIDGRFLVNRHGPCPMCGGKDRFRFDDRDGTGSYICGQCGAGNGFKLLMLANGWTFREAVGKVGEVIGTARIMAPRRLPTDAAKRAALRALWRGAPPVRPGDLVDRYLRSRGIVLAEFPGTLRTHPSVRYFDGGAETRHPAMLALVRGPTGEPVTVHRTYLAADGGGKAAVDAPRRLMPMPGRLPKGAAIRLGEPLDGRLGLAEGIETALSAALLFGLPCWSAMSTAVLVGWTPPEGVSEVVVFGDNDPGYAGQAAAFALAHRLACDERRALTVRVEIPPSGDWNDVLSASRRPQDSLRKQRGSKGFIVLPVVPQNA